LKSKNVKELINNSAKFLNTMEAMERVRNIHKNGIPAGVTTGWKMFDKYFKFPPMGQLNVLTGFPGAGKSEWLDSLALNVAVHNNWKVFYYSPENYPSEFHLQKLCEKFTDKPFSKIWNGWENVDKKDLDLFEKLISANFTFVDCHINNATIDQILNSIFLECTNRKVNMVIIDPWNKLESQRPPGRNKTDFIGQTLTRIQMFSRQKGISFWIVAHPAKPMRTQKGTFASVTLYDISDSANWYNMVDNGFIIHRNWKDKTGDENLNNLRIAKIKDRRYGKCGDLKFRFIPASGRFEEVTPNEKPQKVQSELPL